MLRLQGTRFFSTSRVILKTLATESATPSGTAKIISSCPVGTKLNLDIRKGKPGPVALEDSEYPAWLWTVLKEDTKKTKGGKTKLVKQENQSIDDQLHARRRQLRKENIAKIKQNNFISQL